MLKITNTVLNNLKSNNSKALSVVRYDKFLKSSIAEVKTENDEKLKSPNSMVAAVFASLKPAKNWESEISTPVTDDKITKASSVNEILSISDGSGISRRHALKVVSTLAEWSSSGKTKVSDFENDARFIKLCRILSKGAKVNRNVASRSEDLSTILGVTADEEAARLISGLNLTQMVKVMSTLTIKKRRSVLLLRTLAYNISASSGQLNLKQSADLLYSMCLLNFIDENLLAKICGDISHELQKDLEKSAVVGSIVTSLGLLKYKNCEILDTLSEWVLNNHTKCRPQDMFSLFITLATVNYIPSNAEELFKVLIPQMTPAEAQRASVWLNYVWSLTILNRATSDHLSSVLKNEFVEKFESSPSNMSARMKILNINGAAKHLLNYKGEVVANTNVTLLRTKEKAKMTETVVDTLKNLMSVDQHLRLKTDTGLGFAIDAECLLDNKCNPVPFREETRSDINRVAILVYDYHDMCIGKVEPTGVNVLACRLLQAQNYKVVTIPYTEFKATDKLVQRVQYVENKLKNTVK